MLFTTWVNTFIGRKIDYDGVYGVQCVDLIKHFEKNVLEVTPVAAGDAWEYFTKFDNSTFLKNNFTKIANTAAFVPQKGDVIVWRKCVALPYGHVAVASGQGNASYFYSYDQNWGAVGQGMTKTYHNYTNVAGVLRPKNQKNITGKPDTSSGVPYTSSYQVRITTNNLNVRKGAGVNYGLVYSKGKVLQVHKPEVYTIVQTVKNGAYTWGKLKSGAGWIALDYTVRI